MTTAYKPQPEQMPHQRRLAAFHSEMYAALQRAKLQGPEYYDRCYQSWRREFDVRAFNGEFSAPTEPPQNIYLPASEPVPQPAPSRWRRALAWCRKLSPWRKRPALGSKNIIGRKL